METGVVVALIAAVVALGTSLITVYNQRALARDQKDLAESQDASSKAMAKSQQKASEKLELLRHELEAEGGREERERDAEEQLNLYREPLLYAAEDMSHRIRNIREMGLLGYLNSPDEHRQQMAMLGTLYRFGKYWGTVDSLYGTVNLLQFNRNPATKDVADLLDLIGSAFASDKPDYGGGTLMVWREEQRAIAELMQRDTGGKTVIGFATFVRLYPSEFAPWFSAFERDLRLEGIEASPRLKALQTRVDRLVAELGSASRRAYFR
jgi:hypothetical protein